MIQTLYTNEVTLTVVQAPILPPPVLISPANNSTEIPKTTTFSWNSVSSATSYRIQISNIPIFDEPTALYHDDVVTGTSIQYTDLVLNRTYYWRVKSINATSESVYSSIYMFTTVQLQNVVPVLISPVDNYENSGTTLNFSWESVPSVTTYRLQVFEITPNQTVFFDDDIVGTSKALADLKRGSSYTWRVRTSVSTIFSNTRKFLIKTIPLEIPEIPVLVAPFNNATNVPLNSVDLTWLSALRAEYYEVQFDESQTLGSAPYNTIELIRTVENLKPNTKYYWRVRAGNSTGTSAYSDIQSFTTAASIIRKPEVPELMYPANYSKNMPISLNLIWGDALRATDYEVYIADNRDFNGPLMETVQSTSKTVSNLKNDTTYYWKVRSKNSSGYSDYSDVWTFVTTQIIPDNPKPGIPVLLSPENKSKNVQKDVTFRWAPSQYATQYNINLYENGVLVSQKMSLVASVTFTDLKNNTRYTWKVNAENRNGVSDYSIEWEFTTIKEFTSVLPGLVNLISPTNGAKNVSIANIRFSWSTSANANSYEFSISKFADFSEMVVDVSLGDIITDVSTLQRDTTYYWRVRGVNKDGVGEYSYSSFSTVSTNPIPLPPELIYPENFQKNVPKSFVFSWESSANATSYDIVLSKTIDFSSIIFNETTNYTSYKVTGLDYNESYYWKVRAHNTYGTSDYSFINKFTIIPKIPPIDPTTDPKEFIYKYFPNHAEEIYELYKRTIIDNPRITLEEFVQLVISTRGDIFVSITSTPVNTSLYPQKGEKVTVLGDTVSIVWYAYDLSNVNIFFYKGNDKLLITNKAVKDGQNKYNIFIDNSLFSPDFQPCKIRIEMKENPAIYADSVSFKVLRVR